MKDESTAAKVRDIVTLVDRGIEIARNIARGLFSSELEGEGLISALEGLAETTSREHQIECSFQHSRELTISPEKATQLYWIAREAVTNALRHADPKRIQIRLNRADHGIELRVDDDGSGIAHSGGEGNGIGLQVMRQRAELAGGSLSTTHGDERGTAVRCVISVDSLT
jgi:signal transduction histidine kinase